MRATLCLFAGLVVVLGGCRRATDTLTQFAENTRTSTERMAVDSAQENERRERRAAPDIAELRSPPAIKLVKRYETRQGPDGLFVYDTERHSTARFGAQLQSGLTPEQATEVVDALEAADAKGVEH